MSTTATCPCCPRTPAPAGYCEEPIDTLSSAEMDWDDNKHTQLTQPDVIKYLDKDLGNDPETVKQFATNFGCCSSFRVLSDEGVRVMDHCVAAIEKHAVCSPRIPKVLRGGTLRSKYLNGMGHSEAVLRQISSLAGCEMIYHPMKIHQLHINFKPDEDVDSATGAKKNIDRWHCDSTPFVLIVFATDPDEYTGGTLQYFEGTREEGMSILSSGASLPANRILNVGRQKKGYGVFMQGWRVFHQVTAVLTGNARTTLVYSFQPRNVLTLEACVRLKTTYNLVDPMHFFLPEWTRYRAWKALRRVEIFAEHWTDQLAMVEPSGVLAAALDVTREKLTTIVQTLPFTADRQVLVGHLEDAMAPLRAALQATFPMEQDGELASTSEAVQEFAASKHGLQNLRGAVVDSDNCIEDVLTLKENETAMVYF